MTVSDFLHERNKKISERYIELKRLMRSNEAKNVIRKEFSNISISTIEQILYNKKYSNSPKKEL